MAHFAAGFKFEITKVKKQNSLYYSVFFYRWKSCKCSSIFDQIIIKSEKNLNLYSPELYDIVKTELNKSR